jgi:hypothetical protein
VPTGPDIDAEPEPRGISERGLAALRVAATLVHGVPDLRVRLSQGDVAVAEVCGGDGPPVRPVTARWLTPCAFRAAVVAARRRWDEGVRLALPGVEGDPVIDVGVPARGRTFPGGIVRVPCGGRCLYVVALCGEAARFAPVVAEVVREGGEGPRGRLGLRADAGLGTALCFLEVDGRPVDGPAVDLLGRLLARCTAEQVCAEPMPAG